MKKILSVVLILSVLGCAHVPYASHMDLRPGMSKQDVLATLGPPAKKERYQKYNQIIEECLFYSNYVSYESQTPICFMDNKLSGWGRSYYEDHRSMDDIKLR